MKISYQGYLYESVLENKPTKNSLNEDIANTSEGIANFWRWFGSSVTVDESGRPIVFYHGTSTEFESFEHSWDREDDEGYSTEGYSGGNIGTGFYFTKNKEYASRFGKPGKFYLRITKLFDLSDESIIESFNQRFEEEKDDLNFGTHGEMIDNIISDDGYDGVFAMGAGGLSYGADEWMVVEGTQVKSINNSGEFSNSNKFAKE